MWNSGTFDTSLPSPRPKASRWQPSCNCTRHSLSKGKLDAAFLRRERGLPNLAFRLLVKERLTVILPTDHRLAALIAIRPQDLAGETFVNVSSTAPVLRAVIDDYLKRSGVKIRSAHEADHLALGMSLLAATCGVWL